jgi:hypothetical protein
MIDFSRWRCTQSMSHCTTAHGEIRVLPLAQPSGAALSFTIQTDMVGLRMLLRRE